MTLEGVEVAGPQLAIGFEPGVECLEGTRFEVVDALLRGDARRDEAGLPQDFEVFGDGGLAERECLHQVRDAAVAAPQVSDDGAAMGLGEDGEGISHSA